MVKICCPECATKLRAKDEMTGKTIKCPRCNSRFVVESERLDAEPGDNNSSQEFHDSDKMEFFAPKTPKPRFKRSGRPALGKSRKRNRPGRGKSRIDANDNRSRSILIGVSAGGAALTGLVVWVIFGFTGGDRSKVGAKQTESQVASHLVQPLNNPSESKKSNKKRTAEKNIEKKIASNKSTEPMVQTPHVAKKNRDQTRKIPFPSEAKKSRRIPYFVPDRIVSPQKAVTSQISKPIDFKSISLREVLRTFSDDNGLQIMVRTQELADLGYSLDTLLSASFHRGTVADGFSAILRPLELEWTVHNGVFVVCRNDADRNLLTRAYQVPYADVEKLEGKILQLDVTKHGAWQDTSGVGGAIDIVQNDILVLHNKITILLEIERRFKSSLKRLDVSESSSEFMLSGTTLPSALFQQKVDFEVDRLKLKDALKQIGERTGLTISINEMACRAEGIDVERPTSCQLHGLKPFQTLNLLLEPLMLTWILNQDGTIEVTTQRSAKEMLLIGIHRVDMCAAEDLIRAVQSTPGLSWVELHGIGGTVQKTDSNSLRIQQTIQGHMRVAQVLAHFRKSKNIATAPSIQQRENGFSIPLFASGPTEIPLQRFALSRVIPSIARQGKRYMPVIVVDPRSNSVSLFGPNDQQIAVQAAPSTVQLLDRSSWKPAARSEQNVVPVGRLLSHRDQVLDTEIREDGKLLATGSGRRAVPGNHEARGRLCFWDPNSGDRVAEPVEFRFPVRRTVFSPDGTLIAVSSSKQQVVPTSNRSAQLTEAPAVRIYDSKSRERKGTAIRHVGEVDIIHFSDSGELLLTAGPTDQNVKLYDTATGRLSVDPLNHLAGIVDAAISSDGGVVVTTCYDSHIYFWNTRSGKLLIRRKDGNEPAAQRSGSPGSFLAISPDGKRVASASYLGRTIRLWESPSGKSIGQPMVHRKLIVSLQFSPDGRLLLSGSSTGIQGAAQLWSADNGKSIGPPMQHRAALNRAQFSHDGELILTFGQGNARLWQAPGTRLRTSQGKSTSD